MDGDNPRSIPLSIHPPSILEFCDLAIQREIDIVRYTYTLKRHVHMDTGIYTHTERCKHKYSWRRTYTERQRDRDEGRNRCPPQQEGTGINKQGWGTIVH